MSMKVFNLACAQDHRFEGWFASVAAYDDQQSRRLIECPICGSRQILKMPAAPRLNLSQKPPAPHRSDGRTDAGESRGDDGGNRPAPGQPGPNGHGSLPMEPAQFQAMFLQMVRKIMDSTEDVGDRFAEEARRIHYSETPERAIRGSATREQAAELRDEGIDVVALPIPKGLNGPLQ